MDLDLLVDISDFLDNYTDADDSGPNRAMQLKMRVDELIEELEKK